MSGSRRSSRNRFLMSAMYAFSPSGSEILARRLSVRANKGSAKETICSYTMEDRSIATSPPRSHALFFVTSIGPRHFLPYSQPRPAFPGQDVVEQALPPYLVSWHLARFLLPLPGLPDVWRS